MSRKKDFYSDCADSSYIFLHDLLLVFFSFNFPYTHNLYKDNLLSHSLPFQ